MTEFDFDPAQSETTLGRAFTDKTVYGPCEPVELSIDWPDSAECMIYIYDSRNQLYAIREQKLDGKQTSIRFLPRGSSGTHVARIRVNNEIQRLCFFRMEPHTGVTTGKPEFDNILPRLQDAAAKCRGEVTVDGKTVSLAGRAGDTTITLWFRDGTYGLLGYALWYPAVKEFCEFFLETQDETGHFQGNFQMQPDIPEDYRGRCYSEPDLEYIAVLAVHRTWQATGDDTWLKKQIPKLEKGLLAAMSERSWEFREISPGRTLPAYYLAAWNQERQMFKRVHTCDTWDFNIPAPDGSPVFVIALCDQTGYYQAMRLLGDMLEHLGRKDESEKWKQKAERLKQHTNELLWDGGKFLHHIHLDTLGHPGFDEQNQLAMSNTWAVNRGMADHTQAVSIIEKYRKRWRETGDYAPWWSLQPGYPTGSFPGKRRGEWAKVNGCYANGGLISWTGGELALASLEHGFEEFGVEQLKLFAELLEKNNGGPYTWYWPDGEPGLSTPMSTNHSIWDVGSWTNALLSGLAGIRDTGKQFENVNCSPRWAAAKVDSARAVCRYPVTDAYFAYSYQHEKESGGIAINFAGTGNKVNFSVLLPNEIGVAELLVNNVTSDFSIRKIENSRYCEFSAEIRKTFAPEAFFRLKERLAENSIPSAPADLNTIEIRLK